MKHRAKLSPDLNFVITFSNEPQDSSDFCISRPFHASLVYKRRTVAQINGLTLEPDDSSFDPRAVGMDFDCLSCSAIEFYYAHKSLFKKENGNKQLIYTDELSVEPKHRRKGYAKLIYRFAMCFLSRSTVANDSIVLHKAFPFLDAHNEHKQWKPKLKALYHSLGFADMKSDGQFRYIYSSEVFEEEQKILLSFGMWK